MMIFLSRLGLFLAVVLAALPASAVTVQRVVSDSGIEAWLVEDHANPILSVRFAFRGGAALDPAGREGLAHLAASTLDEGAGEMDSQAFQGRLEELSITLRFTADLDSFGGRLMTLSETADEAVRLLRLSLTQPRFDGKAVDRIRRQIAVSLRRALEDPNAVASRTLMKRLYPDHPYGRPAKGTLKSLAAITTDDLKAFHKSRLGRDNLVIGVAGDVTPGQVKDLLDRAFGGLPEKAAPWALAKVPPMLDGGVHVTEKPVPQSTILLAQAGLARHHPDFFPAFVLNHMLGGSSFTSRLYEEVREKRGLAYSVSSQLYPLDYSSLLLASVGTANARARESLDVIRAEWVRAAKQGFTAREVADAKTYLTGSFPLRFSSSSRIAGILVGMQLDTLGIDYLDRRNGLVEAVTTDAVNRVARTLIAPESLTAVAVGQPEGLTAAK